MNRQQKIKQLQDLQKTLEGCTRPVEGHSDPSSINDCWNWMRELISEIKDEDEKLLLRAEQFQREQKAILRNEYDSQILVGIDRIVNLIKRHFGLTSR